MVIKIFDSLGNVPLEVLMESPRRGLVIRSGELSPESSDNSSDLGESFAFGNDESD